MEISNKITDFHQDILNLNKKISRETVLKCLLATAALVASVALIVFVSGNLLAIGIGILLISGFGIYQYFNDYSCSKNLFKHAREAIEQTFSLSIGDHPSEHSSYTCLNSGSHTTPGHVL